MCRNNSRPSERRPHSNAASGCEATDTYFQLGATRSSDSINFRQMPLHCTQMDWINWDWLGLALGLIGQAVSALQQALPGVRYLPNCDQFRPPPSVAAG
jgi:hypothetical protein